MSNKNDKKDIDKVTQQEEEQTIDLKPEPNLEEEIVKLNEEIEKLKNDYAKAYADTENTRRRLSKEAEQIKKYRIQSFALEILPVVDNLERALENKPVKEAESYYQGVKMVYDQLIKVLKDEGVEEIEALDCEFDPNFMQSIMIEKVEGKETNTVVEVFQKGYKLKDRILRAAMVKIAE